MKKFAKLLIVTIPLIVMSLLATGVPVRVADEYPTIPEGQVIGLQMRTVIYGIKTVIAGKPGTAILTDGKGHYIFQWATQYSGNFACFDVSGTGCVRNVLSMLKDGGNATNVKSLSELKDFLLNNGYKVIKPDEMPEVLKVLFSGTVSYLAQMATNWGTFLILPAGVFDVPVEYLPAVKEIG